MDLILYNGKLHTQDRSYPEATAIAMLGGRILGLGFDDEILPLAGPGTQVINLQGRRVLPGLTDAHFHFHDWALTRQNLHLAGLRSRQEILAHLQEAARTAPKGSWILGHGWNETDWPEPRLLDRTELDAAAPHNPVMLWRSDMHLAVASSLALKRAGITAATRPPADGVIDHDHSGQPTGVLRELAIGLIRKAIPASTEDQTIAAIEASLSELHRLGLTGLHDYRIMGGADGPPAFRAYQRLDANGALALRLWMNLPLERLDEAIALGLRSGFGGDFLRVGHVKMFSDGSQGARTAWMLEPYIDTGAAGMPLTPMDQIAEAVHKADRAGLGVAIHAIGDRANRELIGVFEEVLVGKEERSEPAPDARAGFSARAGFPARHRIEHVQNIRPDDVRRMGRLGLVASVQPIHATDDLPMIEASVGERGRYAYVFRDLLEAGVTLALGSDCPVADPNPFWGIHAAVTRRRRDGSPEGGWYPEQRLSVTEAVWGYTMGPALVAGQAARQGSLSPGKFADLVVLDRDIFTIDPMEIADVKPALTVFNGRVVYEA
jgi:predicted amidohydrolase YtcJ